MLKLQQQPKRVSIFGCNNSPVSSSVQQFSRHFQVPFRATSSAAQSCVAVLTCQRQRLSAATLASIHTCAVQSCSSILGGSILVSSCTYQLSHHFCVPCPPCRVQSCVAISAPAFSGPCTTLRCSCQLANCKAVLHFFFVAASLSALASSTCCTTSQWPF